ncbi:MAG: hypothetical protein NDJ90_13185 [Oligoflexia bacterium]|nr:hypothetical protein [Oligoflexia bacterium]
MKPRSLTWILLAASALCLMPGCALLVGNVKPVDEKSTSYGVMDLAKAQPAEWVRLSPEKVGSDENSSTELSDVAFQSQSTSSIISLNTACRPSSSAEEDRQDLQKLTNLLLLGIGNITGREEVGITIQEVIPALQTTLQGKLNGEEMKLRTVVFRKSACVYDLIYMARPQNFARHEQDFSHFVASIRLR